MGKTKKDWSKEFTEEDGKRYFPDATEKDGKLYFLKRSAADVDFSSSLSGEDFFIFTPGLDDFIDVYDLYDFVKEKCQKEQEEFEKSGKEGEYTASVSVEWLRHCIYEIDTDTFELGEFLESSGQDGVYWVWNKEKQELDEEDEEEEDEDEDDEDDEIEYEEEEEFDPVKELKYAKASFEGLLKEKTEAVKSGDYTEDDYLFLIDSAKNRIKELEKQVKEQEENDGVDLIN